MIGVSGKKWIQKKVNKNSIEKIKQNHNFSETISKLIISRNFDENEIFLIENFLQVSNPFKKNKDFVESIKLILKTIHEQGKICILGDYDVDGSASTAMLVNYFKSIKHPFFYYIPDREKDGYGASKKLFKKLILEKPKLIIMVDCGSTSVEAVNFLNKKGIKSLIIDHHEISKPYPNANAIINPKKNNGYIEYDYFCATTLTYFFLKILSSKIDKKFNIDDYLIYVLLATVCDVMPLRKLNRVIAIQVLKNFDINKNIVFNEIYQLSKRRNKININDLGYLIGPILNSGGRLGKSNYATELLSSNSYQIIKKKTLQLIEFNKKRKLIESSIIKEIDFNKILKENKNIIIYYNPNINEGLIGIIAARLKDFFNKPTLVITASGEILKGSARSINNFNIGSLIKNALDKKILINGGGHNMAAGFTLKKNDIKKFQNFLQNSFKKKNIIEDVFNYDDEVSSTAYNKKFFNEIKKLEPYGNGNPLPIFLLKELKIIKSSVLKKKHIYTIFKSKIGLSINSIAFNSVNTKVGEYLLNYKKSLHVLGHINETVWNNKNTLQFTVIDLIL
jgi:single-stranded-DNA-specific exonuclease